MDLSDALQYIQANRKVILFLGAGFSNAATNRLDLPTPSASQLSNRILKRLELEGTANLGLAIDKLREKLTPSEAFEFASNQLTVDSIRPEQEITLSLPWTRIYTTNVDNIGSSFSKRKCHDAATESNPASFGDFIYLHGSIANCTATNYYKNLKLGEQLYLSGARSGSGYFHLLKQDLYECDAAFVVGYSMADPDLAEIFFNSRDLLNKCFVLSGTTDELAAYRLSLIGKDTKLGLENFAQLIRERQPSTSPPLRSEIAIDRGTFDTKEVSQTARQNLLIFGRFDSDVARTSWTAGSPSYAIKRQIAETLSSLSGPQIAVLHSHLGNGKSVVFEYAKFQKARQGGPVYTVKQDVNSDDLGATLADIPSGSHVFYEGNFFAVSDVVKIVQERSLVFCVTSRTTTVRVAMPALAKAALNIVPLQTFDLNRLTRNELRDFHELIDSMAFWPDDLRSLATAKRLAKLEDSFDANISAIVVKIFENEIVQKQILDQWTKAKSSLQPIMDHFIVASYLQMIDVGVPAYILNEFQHMDFKLLSELQNDIIHVSHSGRVSFGNSIVAEFVLGNHPKKNDVIGPIVRFANFIDGHSAQRSLQWIVRRLLRYWNLNRLLKSSTQPNEVLDRASYIPSVNSDPLFWVQYSIAQMENGHFLPAERFLGTAYGRAADKGQNFDTYQIDTHAARLTIRKIAAFGMYDGASKDILAGVRKLRAVVQRRPDDVYHVASVVSQILKSEVNWSYVLSDSDFGAFKRELEIIGLALASPSSDLTFAPEREAQELIRKLFT